MRHVPKFSRRTFLGTLTLTVAGAIPCLADDKRHGRTVPELPLAPVIDAFVDILIPQDELTPAASQIGVGRHILDLGRRDPAVMQWLKEGVAWLQELAPQGFEHLPVATQERVVAWMAAEPMDSSPRHLFEIMRFHAMTFYYSDPRSWAGLVITQPPQPRGYPDFFG